MRPILCALLYPFLGSLLDEPVDRPTELQDLVVRGDGHRLVGVELLVAADALDDLFDGCHEVVVDEVGEHQHKEQAHDDDNHPRTQSAVGGVFKKGEGLVESLFVQFAYARKLFQQLGVEPLDRLVKGGLVSFVERESLG